MTELQPLTIDPRRCFGRACINGTRIPAEAIAENVYAGDGVDDTADDYDITRTDVLLACWWYVYDGHIAARRGIQKRQWTLWADHALMILGGHLKGVELCDPDDYEPTP